MTDARTVILSIEFNLRNDRILAASGSAEMNGVPTSHVVNATLGIMEELIFHELSEHPRVKELVEWEVPLRNMSVPLEERTKMLVTKLLAHQVLLGRVAGRKYVTSGSSARFAIPYDG